MKNKLLLSLILFPLFVIGQNQIGQTLFGSENGSFFGGSLAINQDGSRIIVGANQSNMRGSSQVFELINNNWVELFFEEGTEISEFFGVAVDMSASGTTIAIGSGGLGSTSMPITGGVKVYTEINNTFELKGNIIISPDNDDRFGVEISLSEDGQFLAVSATGSNANDGLVYVYNYNTSTEDWQLLGDPISNDTIGDGTGVSIDLKSVNGIVYTAVGSPVWNNFRGLTQVFAFINDNWVQVGQTIQGLLQRQDLGRSVSFSSDATILAVGASGSPTTNSTWGEVDVFKFNESENLWEPLGEKIRSDLNFDNFGTSISINNIGNKIVIGADKRMAGSGKVYRYDYNTSIEQWVLNDHIFDGFTNSSSFFGAAVAMSGDGSSFIGGATGNTETGVSLGTARVYGIGQILDIESNIIKNNISVYPNPSGSELLIQGPRLYSLKIYDSLGRMIKAFNEKDLILNKLDLQGYKNGHYFLEITTEIGVSYIKVIKD